MSKGVEISGKQVGYFPFYSLETIAQKSHNVTFVDEGWYRESATGVTKHKTCLLFVQSDRKQKQSTTHQIWVY